MSIFKLAGRVAALVIGIVGSVVALIVTLITVVAFHTNQLFDTSGLTNTSHSHGFIGFLCFVLGVIGSLAAILFPGFATLLLLIAGLVMLYVAGGWGLIPLVILALAAWLAFADRSSARARAAR